MEGSSTVHIFATLAEASRSAAEAIVDIAREAVAARGRCAMALAGGHSPDGLYRLLASEFSRQMPWARAHLFWSDERYVPPGDPDSNYGMAKRVLLDHVPCPPENVHPMPTLVSPAAAAAVTYEQTLRDFFDAAEPRFDVMLLGVGADGHTGSLFPHSPSLHEQARWVVATTAPAKPAARLSMTFPIINQAAQTFVLAAGPDKIAIAERALLPDADPAAYPIARLRESRGHVHWWLARVP